MYQIVKRKLLKAALVSVIISVSILAGFTSMNPNGTNIFKNDLIKRLILPILRPIEVKMSEENHYSKELAIESA